MSPDKCQQDLESLTAELRAELGWWCAGFGGLGAGRFATAGCLLWDVVGSLNNLHENLERG